MSGLHGIRPSWHQTPLSNDASEEKLRHRKTSHEAGGNSVSWAWGYHPFVAMVIGPRFWGFIGYNHGHWGITITKNMEKDGRIYGKMKINHDSPVDLWCHFATADRDLRLCQQRFADHEVRMARCPTVDQTTKSCAKQTMTL